jgi:hypothetical protein
MMKNLLMLLLCLGILMSTLISSIAYCQSGWVLWTQTEVIEGSHGSKSWQLVNAYPNHNQCLQIKKKVWQGMKKSNLESMKKHDTILDVSGEPEAYLHTTYKEGNMQTIVYFYCLPGTLDPRDKK